MINYLAVFLGGGLGAMARFAVGMLMSKVATGAFPWGTLAANLIGAFLIGALSEVLALRTDLSLVYRYFLVTGFLGGFTTFSAFSLEASVMIERGDYMLFVAYVLSSLIGTIALVFAAMYLVRHFS